MMDPRETYLDYAALTAKLESWARDYPDCVRLQSIGRSTEGRAIHVLTVGQDPDRPRPAVWVDGNMHAAELAGSNVALAIAEAVIRLHDPRAGTPPDLPPSQREALQDVLFHICPRISPDGAEQVWRQGGFLRSAPRRTPEAEAQPHWRLQDLDGDGLCRYLRVVDPSGDFVAHPEHPGLMLPRTLEDPPPYYRLYPEGVIENWDGNHIPDPQPTTGTPDFNRNFAYRWRPEPDQRGAGEYPGSEPETRAVMDFATAHPELYAWLNLHTFGGVFIRPLLDSPDARMDAADLRVFRQLGAWADELVGYPSVSGFEEFTYEPDTPLYGDLVGFAYHQRGCLAQVCELWDLFARLDQPRPERFVEHYGALDRDGMARLAQWDQEHNKGRLFRAWQPLEHPQVGNVEVGGLDPIVGIWNPPPEELDALATQMSRYWLRVASLLPRLVIEEATVIPLGGGHARVSLAVANHGYLPTQGMNAARERPFNTPVEASIELHDAILQDGDAPRVELGHLAGWGRGLGDTAQMPWFQRSEGSNTRTRTGWVVAGSGSVTLRVGNRRLGFRETHLKLPTAN